MLDQSVLVYKRTHPGDPDLTGVFGVEDCMGRVRWVEADVVIGIGGIGPEARSYGIDGRLSWIGIGARRENVPADWIGWRGPLVTFKLFRLWEETGPLLSKVAPALFKRFCNSKAPRYATEFSKPEERDIKRLIAMARRKSSTKTSMTSSQKTQGKCRPRRGSC